MLDFLCEYWGFELWASYFQRKVSDILRHPVSPHTTFHTVFAPKHQETLLEDSLKTVVYLTSAACWPVSKSLEYFYLCLSSQILQSMRGSQNSTEQFQETRKPLRFFLAWGLALYSLSLSCLLTASGKIQLRERMLGSDGHVPEGMLGSDSHVPEYMAAVPLVLPMMP